MDNIDNINYRRAPLVAGPIIASLGSITAKKLLNYIIYLNHSIIGIFNKPKMVLKLQCWPTRAYTQNDRRHCIPDVFFSTGYAQLLLIVHVVNSLIKIIDTN